MKLNEKTAIVTGATSGMGKAIAVLFAAEGACVVLSGRDRSRGEAAVREIESKGGRALFVEGDISQLETNARLIRAAQDQFGRLDVLVPNAAALGLGSVTEVPLETWESTIATNLHSVFYLLRLGIPEMQKTGGGSIVVNGSIAAVKGFPNHAAYCASKGALVALVRQVAIDYGPAIRINLLHPGPVDTPLIWNSVQAFGEPEAIIAKVASNTLIGRLGQPEDIAKAALFLASDDSAWITGTVLTIDGGITTGGK